MLTEPHLRTQHTRKRCAFWCAPLYLQSPMYTRTTRTFTRTRINYFQDYLHKHAHNTHTFTCTPPLSLSSYSFYTHRSISTCVWVSPDRQIWISQNMTLGTGLCPKRIRLISSHQRKLQSFKVVSQSISHNCWVSGFSNQEDHFRTPATDYSPASVADMKSNLADYFFLQKF